MAICKFYLICGCCGCDDHWEWSYSKAEYLDDGEMICSNDVLLHCENCGKLHTLSDNAKERKKSE